MELQEKAHAHTPRTPTLWIHPHLCVQWYPDPTGPLSHLPSPQDSDSGIVPQSLCVWCVVCGVRSLQQLRDMRQVRAARAHVCGQAGLLPTSILEGSSRRNVSHCANLKITLLEEGMPCQFHSGRS